MDSFQGKTVLLTGASVGIGKCFAEQLAEKKANLILVARREDKMRVLADELTRRHGIKVDVIAKDLSQPAAAKELFDETTRRGWQVDILINNAGFGIGGAFLDTTLERNLEMIQLNITTLMELTYRYLPGMVERKGGAVINVASTASFQAVPYLGTYSATKAFVLSFSEALWEEYRHHNVTVMALCPGTTATEFFDVAGVKERTAMQTPDDVVRTALRGLKAKRSHIISGMTNYLMAQSNRLVPREIGTRIAGSLFRPEK
ncbi:MAG: SDR family oxidoreductase [Acidobacteria bacterium]|nr:SDR family oxidoreductase [Acidobacteriota bacterium]